MSSSRPGRRCGVALVQHAWGDDPDRLVATFREGIEQAAGAGAKVVSCRS